MTASTEPRGGLDLGWSSGEDGWGDAMNANLLRLSRLGFHPSVLSAMTTAPPGSPISGSGYIIPSGATGAWAGKTGQVAVWDGVAWAYAAPRDGWTMHVDGAGLTTYDGGAWSQANVATAAGVGAEPYAGIPAQTSFWRSTAAGVRAWVQLVASDITDLATTLAAYLTKANPTFTGLLTGPSATLTDFGKLTVLVGDSSYAAIYGTGVTPSGSNYSLRFDDSGSSAVLNASTALALAIGGASKVGVTTSEMNLASGVALKMAATTVIDASRNITGATIKGGNLAGTGNRPLVAGADGTIDDQDAATFRDTISAPPTLSFTGTVDAKNINSGKTGLYRLAASTYTNFWTGITAGQEVSVLQLESNGGARALIAADNKAGGLLARFQASDFPGDDWSDWYTLWDSGSLPVGTTGRAVLATTTQAGARAAIGAAPLAGAEILIHSDFGRSATTDVWQSAFTNNTASGLQLAANTTATGTEITIEQVVDIPADGGAAAYQVYIGPQLTGEQSPTGSTYVDVVDPNTEYGAGILRIKIELLGSGSSITGYVTSTLFVAGFVAPFVRYGEIAINGTIANSIDIRFNPDSQTAYIIRRNRVFRRNP